MPDATRLGARYLGNNRCSFRVWAPYATNVAVRLLAPDGRLLPLTREGDYFTGRFDGIGPGSLYFYQIDGHKERPDPASRFQPQGVHGPSQVVSLDFPWEDQGWPGLRLRDYVIYEIHVGTFTPEGTFEAIIARLPRLRDLGITALELMPVAQFPGQRNWGYDGAYPYAVQNSYGGPTGLFKLVNACHREGLAVILDVVYNHLGPEGNYTGDFGPYSTECYRTPWGGALNFDQRHCDPVREFFIHNALFWITAYHIDALRLDALHAVIDTSGRPFLGELAEAVRDLGARLERRVYLMAESDRNDVRCLVPPHLGGLGLDCHWLDDWHHALHTRLTKEADGYYQDFASWETLVQAYREGFVYTGQYSRFRGRRHGSSSRGIHPRRFIVFSQNHDQVGNRLGGERLSRLVSWSGLKLAAAAVILSPFTPLLFMGEEYGESAPFLYFVSHGDPELVAAVRQGRAQEFAAFGWPEDPPDPQAPETMAACRLNLELAQQEPHRSLWAYYRELLRLRREMITGVDLGAQPPQVADFPGEEVMRLHYASQEQHYCVFLGFSPQPQAVALPQTPAPWRLLLNSEASRWAGSGMEVAETLEAGAGLYLPPLSCVVYHASEEPA